MRIYLLGLLLQMRRAIGFAMEILVAILFATSFSSALGGSDDAKAVSPPSVSGAQNLGEPASANQVEPSPKPITGSVRTFEGKPAGGAKVALIGFAWRGPYPRNGNVPNKQFIGQAICDDEGIFRLEHFKQSKVPWQAVQLLVSMPGNALDWWPLDLYAEHPKPFEFSLQRPQEMRGRLLSENGNAAAGIPVLIARIGQGRNGFDGLLVYHSGLPNDIYSTTLSTDTNGEFVVGQLPPNARVGFIVEQVRLARKSWLWSVDDPAPHVTTMDPGQTFAGVVVAADTGQALAHANVWAQNVLSQTDAEGHFQVNVPKAIAFDLQAFAPNGTPYLGKRFTIKTSDAEKTAELKLELPRGVKVRGQVIEQDSINSVANACIEYVPLNDNPQAVGFEFPIPSSGAAVSDEHGGFILGVPRGKGALFIRCAGIDHVQRQISSALLKTGKIDPTGDTTNVCGYQSIDIPEGIEELPLQIALERGVTIQGTVVDTDGATPALVAMTQSNSRIEYSNTAATRPKTLVYDGKLAIHGIPPGGERLVWLLDPFGKQGKLLHVRASDADKPLRVVLEKCGSVTRRYVDPQGNPVAGYKPEFLAVQLYYLPPEMLQESTSNESFVNAYGMLIDLIDSQNCLGTMTDENGRITYPALIPNAIYAWLPHPFSGKMLSLKVRAGEHLDLPDIVIDKPEEVQKAAKRWAELQKSEAAPATTND